jgi:hypothetical protein
MSIYIHVNQQTSGPYEENAVTAWLQAGQLSPEALACRQGASAWQPLRTLLPAQARPSAFDASTQTANQPAASPQAVVNWARRTLPNRVEVTLKNNSRAARLLLHAALFSLPALIFIFGIINLFTSTAYGLTIIFIFGAIFVALLFALFLYLFGQTRGSFVRYMEADGVETLNGTKYRWENLQYVNYKSVRRSQGGVAVAVIYSGLERVTVELIFQTGKALIPPLIHYQKEILRLIETIPAPRAGG